MEEDIHVIFTLQFYFELERPCSHITEKVEQVGTSAEKMAFAKNVISVSFFSLYNKMSPLCPDDPTSRNNLSE